MESDEIEGDDEAQIDARLAFIFIVFAHHNWI
jgi:hypothetical protein